MACVPAGKKTVERRVYTRSDWADNYFPTWRLARDFLLERSETKITDLTRTLARERTALRKIKALRAVPHFIP